MQDERALFTVEEFTLALSLVIPAGEIDDMVMRLLEPAPSDALSPVHLSDDVLDCLSLVSNSAAERVRIIRGISHAASEERRKRFWERVRP